MFFGVLKKKYKDMPIEETKAVGMKWAGLLKTSGIDVSVFPVQPGEILFTEYEGRLNQIREYVHCMLRV